MSEKTRSGRAVRGVAVATAVLAAAPAWAQPGTVLGEQKIGAAAGGFSGVLDDLDNLGVSVATLGDLDGNGVVDLAVGTWRDDDGGTNRGAVWILFLNADGTVASHQKISSTAGGFTGVLDDQDAFGAAVDGIGDLDGDGVPDLAVGAQLDDDGGNAFGAAWILLLNGDGTVKAHQKISATAGGFGGALGGRVLFGSSVAGLGDVDGDGVGDIAIGAQRDDDGGPGRGAVWIVFLNSDGTVKDQQKISDTEGGLVAEIRDNDEFGLATTGIGDLDGDGVPDLAVRAPGDDDGGFDRGSVWVLLLNTDGTVKDEQVISSTLGGLAGPLANGDAFGTSVVTVGDVDGDGVADLAVGAERDADGGSPRGAVYVLFLETDGSVAGEQKISAASGGLTGPLDAGDSFGSAVAALGDLDGDGRADLAVGARDDDDDAEGPGGDRGAGGILFLDGAAPNDCLGDITGQQPGSGPDGFVDVNDLNTIFLDWGTDGSANNADITGQQSGSPPDGFVDVNDLNAVILNWGVCR